MNKFSPSFARPLAAGLLPVDFRGRVAGINKGKIKPMNEYEEQFRFWEQDRLAKDKLHAELVVAWVCCGVLATALLFVVCCWATGGK